MLNKKEKNVKNYLLDENNEFSNEDKDIVLNKIKSQINLEVEEKPSFKQKFNLKVVYALVCSLVICVVGFIGIIHLGESRFIDPNYMGKDVESLNLDKGDYCLAYSKDIYYSNVQYLENVIEEKISYEKINSSYIVSRNNEYSFVICFKDKYNEYSFNLAKTPKELYELYNLTYNTTFDEITLNNNKKGLLFLIKENGIKFYTIKNGLIYSIFVEFA